MRIPRPDAETKALSASLSPHDEDIVVRPMFGNLAAFLNGNMFAGHRVDDMTPGRVGALFGDARTNLPKTFNSIWK